MNVYDELKLLIDCIQSIYSKVAQLWERQCNSQINLKRCQVREIDIDGIIYKTIIEYINFLNKESIEIIMNLPTACSYRIEFRVKTQNSIEFKIQNYKTERHALGKIPIIKCINDLFGIRVILSSPLQFYEIEKFINERYGSKYRCIDSSKLDYRATHLYFKDTNCTFPWELQIWNECDGEKNLESHRKYKQEYTTWEKESMEGGITND